MEVFPKSLLRNTSLKQIRCCKNISFAGSDIGSTWSVHVFFSWYMILKNSVTLDFCCNTFHRIVYCKHFLWTGQNTCLALQFFLAVSDSLVYMLPETLNTPVCLDLRSFISVYTHSTDLNVVEVHVLGKAAVLVNQKTEPSFLFKESFSTAFCNKSLNITLSRAHGFQILREKGKKIITESLWILFDAISN